MKKLAISLPLILTVALFGFTITASEIADARVCYKHCRVTGSGHVVCWRECYRTGYHRGWNRGWGWHGYHRWHRW